MRCTGFLALAMAAMLVVAANGPSAASGSMSKEFKAADMYLHVSRGSDEKKAASGSPAEAAVGKAASGSPAGMKQVTPEGHDGIGESTDRNRDEVNSTNASDNSNKIMIIITDGVNN